MKLQVPELAVVALIGVSGSGKSTFAQTHFQPTEVLSSDFFRAMVSDDETNQEATGAAFEALYYVAGKRLERGLLTVIDATNVRPEDRASIVRLAREHDCFSVAIVLDLPEKTCQERNSRRPNRSFGPQVIPRQANLLRRSLKHLAREGFRFVHILKDEEEIAAAEIVRQPLWNNKKDDFGPFDIIGDIHGCYDELTELLTKLGYEIEAGEARPPAGRRAIFLGDLCDRGPKTPEVLRLVMNMVRNGQAYSVAGNHDIKLLRHLKGNKVRFDHGFELTAAQLAAESEEFREEVKVFLYGLMSHYVFAGGRLVAAHAGLKEKYQGRGSPRVREFCLYGETTGEIDEYGLPVRLPWAEEYRGRALVVFGHVPAPEPQSLNNTIGLDTGCVFGGRLTAFRYPEKEIVQVASRREYFAPVKPFLETSAENGYVLNIDDVLGQKHLSTRLCRNIRLNAENTAAALEVMSRFAADPRWLIYLPPTMSPCETSPLDDYLEHPLEAFAYYRNHGIGRVICDVKHMGSRAVVVLARDAQAAARRFGVKDGSRGLVYTRTGRPFFDDQALEAALLTRLEQVLTASNFWTDFKTDWVCLDAEIMPWSAKARKLILEQYASTGRAGRSGLGRALAALEEAVQTIKLEPGAGEAAVKSNRTASLSEIMARYHGRLKALNLYTEVYRRYCWEVKGLEDYRLAPFHILATEGRVWIDADHGRHLEVLARYVTGNDPLFQATGNIVVETLDEASLAAGCQWWADLTAAGGEGMVVKPLDFISFQGRKILQPAVKCRGREYLRLIYGPEYSEDLSRLKKRSLSKKRQLALDEFALGLEALARFTAGEPLHRVHECVFGVLALESEPVDPRL